MMKKIVCLVLVCLTSLSLFSCGVLENPFDKSWESHVADSWESHFVGTWETADNDSLEATVTFTEVDGTLCGDISIYSFAEGRWSENSFRVYEHTDWLATLLLDDGSIEDTVYMYSGTELHFLGIDFFNNEKNNPESALVGMVDGFKTILETVSGNIGASEEQILNKYEPKYYKAFSQSSLDERERCYFSKGPEALTDYVSYVCFHSDVHTKRVFRISSSIEASEIEKDELYDIICFTAAGLFDVEYTPGDDRYVIQGNNNTEIRISKFETGIYISCDND